MSPSECFVGVGLSICISALLSLLFIALHTTFDVHKHGPKR